MQLIADDVFDDNGGGRPGGALWFRAKFQLRLELRGRVLFLKLFDFCGGTIPWRELGLLPCLDGFFVVSDSGCTHGLGLGDSMVWLETKISIFLEFCNGQVACTLAWLCTYVKPMYL